MFYEMQTTDEKENYKLMLTSIGSLTLLFSESDCPYLPYRAHENIFCKAFRADNLARSDCSADARKNQIGIGLKTWMGTDDQKVAEFGKLRETFKELRGLQLVKKISEYRNERIRITKNMHGIKTMVYHIVKRVPNLIQIIECSFDYIDIEKVHVLKKRGNINNTYFNDGRHTYHFSTSKNTLYMVFENYEILDQFKINIIPDPYTYLMHMGKSNIASSDSPLENLNHDNQLCLRLFSFNKKSGRFVSNKSGLNQWNASGRKRNPNELYIPYPAEDRRRSNGFFPPRDKTFELLLPDGNVIPAKICQDSGKAIMSNPNYLLGEWLLRKVFEIEEGTLITYDMLIRFGCDSVIFTKISNEKYKINFSEIGTYEKLLNFID